LERAQIQHNLFVILMAGGVLSRRLFVNGQLRQSEKVARQVLEQALAQRGKLPEPASIALSTLSQIYLERNDLGMAQKYLAQALEVDPNPTSTNMLVQAAVHRAEIQMAQSNYTGALANILSVRELHRRRPSGAWTDLDLLAYEAYIHIRTENISSAEQILSEAENMDQHALSQLVRAEISLRKNQPYAAEMQLNSILVHYPNGILSIPAMRTRVLLAKALFDQYKTHQALQMMKETIRLAAPEHFIRPFLEKNILCMPLLPLALETESLTSEAQGFIREIQQFHGYADGGSKLSEVEIESLSASASISPREQEVLRLMSAGYSNRDMAIKLSISESTVKTHVGNIYYKLNVNSRLQAILYAKELKLV
jgi:LuxR family maltose regulon positive regulatory protein